MADHNQNVVEEIKQTAIYNAPIHKVWEKVSTAEGIASWFMPPVDFQLEVGHEFTLQSPFGPSPCKVLEVEKPHLFSFSWDTDGWVVSFILKEIGDQTEFTLIHGGWKNKEAIISKAKQTSSDVRDRMNQGWVDIVTIKLKKVVEA
ncbi:SRPBCC family protein [Bacillus sp. JJ722]|uniref:SRPBCC family protein n=1 Tax=Bacillus sp. JJ722 TaxID=3122973 RepID=UPI002FFDA8FF